jgi:hypothetical protein
MIIFDNRADTDNGDNIFLILHWFLEIGKNEPWKDFLACFAANANIFL